MSTDQELALTAARAVQAMAETLASGQTPTSVELPGDLILMPIGWFICLAGRDDDTGELVPQATFFASNEGKIVSFAVSQDEWDEWDRLDRDVLLAEFAPDCTGYEYGAPDGWVVREQLPVLLTGFVRPLKFIRWDGEDEETRFNGLLTRLLSQPDLLDYGMAGFLFEEGAALLDECLLKGVQFFFDHVSGEASDQPLVPLVRSCFVSNVTGCFFLPSELPGYPAMETPIDLFVATGDHGSPRFRILSGRGLGHEVSELKEVEFATFVIGAIEMPDSDIVLALTYTPERLVSVMTTWLDEGDEDVDSDLPSDLTGPDVTTGLREETVREQRHTAAMTTAVRMMETGDPGAAENAARVLAQAGLELPQPGEKAVPPVIDKLYEVLVASDEPPRVEIHDGGLVLSVVREECDCGLVHQNVDLDGGDSPIPLLRLSATPDGYARAMEFTGTAILLKLPPDQRVGDFVDAVLRRFNLGRAIPGHAFQFEVEGRVANFVHGAVLQFEGSRSGRGPVVAIAELPREIDQG